jgi:hypothetical protein
MSDFWAQGVSPELLNDRSFLALLGEGAKVAGAKGAGAKGPLCHWLMAAETSPGRQVGGPAT